MKPHVIPYDEINIIDLNTKEDYIKTTMYCEVGSEDIDPDDPPTFSLVIERRKGIYKLFTENEDIRPGESSMCDEPIRIFIDKTKDELDKGKIVIPPTEELIGLEYYEIS